MNKKTMKTEEKIIKESEDKKKETNKKTTKKSKKTPNKSKTITTLEKQTGTKIKDTQTLYNAFKKIPDNNKTNNELIQEFKKIAEKEYKAKTRIVKGRIIDEDEQTAYRSWLQIQEKDKWINIDITGARLNKKLLYGALANSKTYMIHEIL